MTGFGILGCGTIGPMHARAIAGLDGARLVAVADTREDRARALAERWDVTARADLDGLLAVPGVDVVCVCTPSGTHAELGTRIVEAGRHVVIEKPFDVDLAAADKLIASADAAGVVLSVISQHRFDAGLLRLHAALRSGELGNVSLVEGKAWWYRAQSYYDADEWRGTWKFDGGALSNQGVHLVDLLLWLLGDVDTVFARSSTAAHRMEAEDTIIANVRFASGVLGALTVTTAAYPGAPETIAVASDTATVRIEAGQVVSWRTADETGDQAATEPSGADVTTAARGSRDLAVDAHRAQLQDVVDAIREGRPPRVTGTDGRAALALIRAAYDSARTGTDIGLAPTVALSPQAEEA